MCILTNWIKLFVVVLFTYVQHLDMN